MDERPSRGGRRNRRNPSAGAPHRTQLTERMGYVSATKAALGVCLSFVLLVFVSCNIAAETESAARITPEEAHKRLSEPSPPPLVDVRTKEEYESGHLKNALLVPLDEIAQGDYAEKLGDIPKEQPIIVYCRSSRRSGRAQEFLVRDGYTNIINLSGGMIAWKKAGLPVIVGGGESGNAEKTAPPQDAGESS